jgi:hypothetical protein
MEVSIQIHAPGALPPEQRTLGTFRIQFGRCSVQRNSSDLRNETSGVQTAAVTYQADFLRFQKTQHMAAANTNRNIV